jgi:hypothetical protein
MTLKLIITTASLKLIKTYHTSFRIVKLTKAFCQLTQAYTKLTNAFQR